MIAEWPLVVFTVASQLACGLALAAAYLDLRSSARDEGRLPGMLVFPVAALALAGSLFHLGRPFAAWRAILNWRSSPLSAEILGFGLFLAAALFTSALWAFRARRGRRASGAVTAAFGLAAIVSSSLIYLLPGRAPWDSAWVPVSFLGSTIVLGATAGLAGRESGAFPRRPFLAASAIGGLAVIASAGLMLSRFSAAAPDAYAAAQLAAARRLAMSDSAVWLAVSGLLAGLLPAGAALWNWRSARSSRVVFRAVFWAVLGGVVAGRLLMFAVGTDIPLF